MKMLSEDVWVAGKPAKYEFSGIGREDIDAILRMMKRTPEQAEELAGIFARGFVKERGFFADTDFALLAIALCYVAGRKDLVPFTAPNAKGEVLVEWEEVSCDAEGLVKILTDVRDGKKSLTPWTTVGQSAAYNLLGMLKF